MTPKELSALGISLFGNSWTQKMALYLGTNEKTVQDWAKGSEPVPELANGYLPLPKIFDKPEWMTTETDDGHIYIFRVKAPRFVCRACFEDENYNISGLTYEDSGVALSEFEWIDPYPNEEQLRSILKSAVDFFFEFCVDSS